MADSSTLTAAARSFAVIDPSSGIVSNVFVSTKRLRAAITFVYSILAYVNLNDCPPPLRAETHIFPLSHHHINWLFEKESKFVNLFEKFSSDMMIAVKILEFG